MALTTEIIDREIDNIFQGDDSEDMMKQKNAIPRANFDRLIDYLKRRVSMIKTHKFKPTEWESFQEDLREDSSVVEELIKFSDLPKDFDLRWENITNSKVCFIVFMILENPSVYAPSPADSMWNYLED